ncbi:MAG TPA: ornithine carbamoyltransferase [Hyphomicrobiales bacterium]|nr:ornithine carbamoyltransferase [Hyphomicrobiales bacterium]
MSLNLHNRSFLTLEDFAPREIHFLLKLSADLKAAKYAGIEHRHLKGKNIALVFEKDSTRTRSGFEVAAHDQGAHVTYIGPTGSHIGHKETVKDTARVLGRMFDGIEYRGFGQEIVEELARYANVPVWNGLTKEFHPTQVLADFLTMTEHSEKRLGELSFCFMGDASSNTCDSLLVGAAKLAMDFRAAAPRECSPSASILEYANGVGALTGAKITVTDRIEEAVTGCDFVYTDVWLSMGESESLWSKRIKLLLPYQVTSKVMAQTGNPQTKFMHCLPAFHNSDTGMGREIKEKFGLDAMEVTEAVFESEASIVFDQAENRMHTIKALLVATLGN